MTLALLLVVVGGVLVGVGAARDEIAWSSAAIVAALGSLVVLSVTVRRGLRRSR